MITSDGGGAAGDQLLQRCDVVGELDEPIGVAFVVESRRQPVEVDDADFCSATQSLMRGWNDRDGRRKRLATSSGANADGHVRRRRPAAATPARCAPPCGRRTRARPRRRSECRADASATWIGASDALTRASTAMSAGRCPGGERPLDCVAAGRPPDRSAVDRPAAGSVDAGANRLARPDGGCAGAGGRRRRRCRPGSGS